MEVAKRVLSNQDLIRLLGVLQREFPKYKVDDIGVAIIVFSLYSNYVASGANFASATQSKHMEDVIAQLMSGILVSLNATIAHNLPKELIQ